MYVSSGLANGGCGVAEEKAELWEENCPPVPIGTIFHFWTHALFSSDTRECQILPLFIHGSDLKRVTMSSKRT